MLKAQKRHQAPCTRAEWDQRSCAGKGAHCPILIVGTLNGDRIRLSTAKFLPPDKARNLEAARDLAILWERTGAVVKPEAYAPVEAAQKDTPSPSVPTVEMAVHSYLEDARARGNSTSAVYKKEGIFARRLKINPENKTGAKIPANTSSLLSFCEKKGIRFLEELDLATVSEWRATWNVNSLVRSKRQGTLIGFLWFCERRGWFPRNFAADVTQGLGRIQVKATQTGYFRPEDYKAIIDATRIYSDRPSIDKHDATTIGGHRIRALTELMRWTGLRIRDAVTLERHRLKLDPVTGLWNVMVYQRKTGDPVYCPIPPHVAELLNTTPASQKGNTNERYFFWTGDGLAKTITSNWQRSYKKLFTLAALKNEDGTPKRCHPHMFRDTFAVEAILSEMPVQRVSEILGHSSLRVTEKHYLPWVRARQKQLNEAVVESWKRQGVYGGDNPAPRKKAAVVKFPKVVQETARY